VPEPLHQPRQEHPPAFAIGIHDVLTGPPHEGQLGEGLLLRTDRGDIQAILHPVVYLIAADNSIAPKTG
jgi:hypothetical protein